MNEECKVIVKTPVGVTEEFMLTDIEIQVTVLAPSKCAGQMDSLGFECYSEENYLYRYNNIMIDDTNAPKKMWCSVC